jgi:hypothetical protein
LPLNTAAWPATGNVRGGSIDVSFGAQAVGPPVAHVAERDAGHGQRIELARRRQGCGKIQRDGR